MNFVALMLMACSNPTFLGFENKKQCEIYHSDCVKWIEKQPEVQKLNQSPEDILLFLTTKEKKELKKLCGQIS